MADIKHTLGLGIGFQPGSLKFTTTSGYGIGAERPVLVGGAAIQLFVVGGEKVYGLQWLETIPGVLVLDIGARNGPGTGLIESVGVGGTSLSWTAPGSSNPGKPVDTTTGGELFLLTDGTDPDKWVYVQVFADYLVPGPVQSKVRLQDWYLTGVPGTEDAFADAMFTTEYEVRNVSLVDDVLVPKVWIDPAAADFISVSADGVLFSSPTTEGTALTLGPSILPGESETLFVRRTIPPGEADDPDLLTILHFVYDWSGVTHYHDQRGKWRIGSNNVYRFYRRLGSPPEQTDTPFDTSPNLAHTPTDVFGDGLWYISVSFYNGYLDSGFLPLGPNGETYLLLEIAGGVEVPQRPEAPFDWTVDVDTNGVTRIRSSYYELGAFRADEWALTFRTGGISTPIDAPDVTLPVSKESGAFLDYDLPAQPTGTQVNVRLQTRRDDGAGGFVYSRDSFEQIVTVPPIVPAPAKFPHHWIGSPPKAT